MKPWRWGLLAAAPLLCGGLLAAVFWLQWLPNRVAYLRADLGTIFLLLGLLAAGSLSLEGLRRLI